MSLQIPSNEELTARIKLVEAGDQQASAELWSYCFPRLLNFCRSKLPDHMRRVLDEEDVALSAFKSFCLGAGSGALGDITSPDELWRLLFCIARRKAQGYVRHQSRQKRGGGDVRGESVFLPVDGDSPIAGIDHVADDSPSPFTLAQLTNDCQVLLEMLEDEKLQTIALLRLEGYSVDEIATRMGCAKRSVERRLSLIRSIWKSAGGLPRDRGPTKQTGGTSSPDRVDP